MLVSSQTRNQYEQKQDRENRPRYISAKPRAYTMEADTCNKYLAAWMRLVGLRIWWPIDDLSTGTSSFNQGSQQCPCGTQTSKSRWNIRGQWAPKSWQNRESLSLQSIIVTGAKGVKDTVSTRHKKDIVVLVCHSHPAAIMALPF